MINGMKKITTVILLVYVAFSIVWLVVKIARNAQETPAIDGSNHVVSENPVSIIDQDMPGLPSEPGSDADYPDVVRPTALSPDRIIVYYFHRTIRCGPCILIENTAREVIYVDFRDYVENGKLEWRAINIDEQENEHFIEEFGLYSQELIFAEVRDGDIELWDNNEEVWQAYVDENRLFDIIRDELASWIGRLEP